MTIGMQVGAWLLHKINLKLHLLIGIIVYCGALYLSQHMQTFTQFVIMYSIVLGFGMGINFFLPIACGWSYFPTIKPIVAGSMFSWIAISSIWWTYISTETLNPSHEKAPIHRSTPLGHESYFDPDSD
jgi:hypothetical protein